MVIYTLRFTIIPLCSQNHSYTHTLESHIFTIQPLPKHTHTYIYTIQSNPHRFTQNTKTLTYTHMGSSQYIQGYIQNHLLNTNTIKPTHFLPPHAHMNQIPQAHTQTLDKSNIHTAKTGSYMATSVSIITHNPSHTGSHKPPITHGFAQNP